MPCSSWALQPPPMPAATLRKQNSVALHACHAVPPACRRLTEGCWGPLSRLGALQSLTLEGLPQLLCLGPAPEFFSMALWRWQRLARLSLAGVRCLAALPPCCLLALPPCALRVLWHCEQLLNDWSHRPAVVQTQSLLGGSTRQRVSLTAPPRPAPQAAAPTLPSSNSLPPPVGPPWSIWTLAPPLPGSPPHPPLALGGLLAIPLTALASSSSSSRGSRSSSFRLGRRAGAAAQGRAGPAGRAAGRAPRAARAAATGASRRGSCRWVLALGLAGADGPAALSA